MNILVLRPTLRRLNYACFDSKHRRSVFMGSVDDCADSVSAKFNFRNTLCQIYDGCLHLAFGKMPDAIAIRVLYGADVFDRPTMVCGDVKKKLENLIPQAPLHLPVLLRIIDYCEEIFGDVPIILLFETAFFASLPYREYLYALDVDLMKNSGFRRYGFNGLHHAAACNFVARKKNGRKNEALKILSICIESKPEVAAVIGNNPVMVTSGGTPLEGIPGQTTCGEIDPSIVINFVEKKKWGPEQINTVLTQESGVYGLSGIRATMEDVFKSSDPRLKLSRDIIQYRILQACGSGIASLGGLDRIVFSGKYASVGEVLGPWLMFRLLFNCLAEANDITIDFFRDSIDRIIADFATIALLKNNVVLS